MEHQFDGGESPYNHIIKTEAINVNTKERDDLVEIKPELDIKLEPDEVDTVENTVTLDRMAGIFVSKKEKIEPHGNSEDLFKFNTEPDQRLKLI